MTVEMVKNFQLKNFQLKNFQLKNFQLCEKCKDIKQVNLHKDEVAICLKCKTPLKKVLKEEVPPIEVGGNVQSQMKLMFGNQ